MGLLGDSVELGFPQQKIKHFPEIFPKPKLCCVNLSEVADRPLDGLGAAASW